MKKSFKKTIGILMVLVLLLAIINVQPTKTEAATKYVKKYTKTITLERYKDYKLPIKMKKAGKLNVKIELLTKGNYVEVVAFPKGKNNNEIETTNHKGGLIYTKEEPQYTKQTFKIKKAPKGNASYLYMYIAGDSEFDGNKVKLKVTITTSKKILSVGKLKEIK